MYPLPVLNCGKRQITSALLSLLGLVLLMTGLPCPTYGAETAESDSPWQIVADSLSYNEQSGIYTAEGHVTITRENETISTDFLEYDQMTQSAFARGNVSVKSRDGDTTTSERMLLDMKTDTGTLYDSKIFLSENHIYIKGQEIRKVGENTYTADKVSITACDGDNPDWKFTGYDLTVTIEGYGTVYHTAFWAKRLPLLYSPFMAFPVKIKRQSGFLTPTLSQSSRRGTEYLQPYFWAINDSSDATFYGRSMSKRGTMLGSEYRYMLSEKSRGTLMADVLDDRRIDDGSDDGSRWGYDDSTTRTNHKRYWYRGKVDQSLPDNATLKLDVDIVSDQDYLREFSSMENGFRDSDSTFTKDYGRNLEGKDDYIRTNSLIFTKTWSAYNLNAGTYWYDDVVKRRLGQDDPTLQKLPLVEFNATRRRLLGSPFYVDLDSETSYFFRQDTTDTQRKGNRTDIHPRLILPLKAANWFSLETIFGFRETYWYIENESETPDTLNGSQTRSMYDLSVDLSTNLNRIFNLGNINGIDKIKHTFTPKMVYAYIPDRDQTDYPYFDGLDRIEPKNTLTLTLSNILTSRSKANDTLNNEASQPAPPKYTYNQFCMFKLVQVYDMNEARETDPEPFKPLYGEIELSPSEHFSLDADATWSHSARHLTSGNVACTVRDSRGDEFRIAQRYTYNELNEDVTLKYFEVFAQLALTDRLSAYILNERDREKHEDLKVSTGFTYTSQCWGVTFDYTNEPDDKRYTITVSLTGLGDFGSSVGLDSLP